MSETQDRDDEGLRPEQGLAASSLADVYERRFSPADTERKDGVWAEIVAYLQRFIPDDARVLDLACDRGSFIRHVRAGERWASDLRDMREWLPESIRFVQQSGLDLDKVLPQDHFDVVFMSNYLEHLQSSAQVVAQLRVAHRLLRKGGLVLVLQPNIRLVGGAYWDFIDHSVALTEHSLAEAATAAGFSTERVITRFLPYSSVGRLPQHPALVRLYLRAPLAWYFMGKQTLYLGRA
ncbi:MAG TPA: class I SAM-dependent methyltransferase [Candidatus Dormibacteraeota bacterium]